MCNAQRMYVRWTIHNGVVSYVCVCVFSAKMNSPQMSFAIAEFTDLNSKNIKIIIICFVFVFSIYNIFTRMTEYIIRNIGIL